MSRVSVEAGYTDIVIHNVQSVTRTPALVQQHVRDNGTPFTTHTIYYKATVDEGLLEEIGLTFYTEGHKNLSEEQNNPLLEHCVELEQDNLRKDSLLEQLLEQIKELEQDIQQKNILIEQQRRQVIDES